MKKCNKCKLPKSLDCFGGNKATKDVGILKSKIIRVTADQELKFVLDLSMNFTYMSLLNLVLMI